jgi:hypothetical protein
MSSRRCGSLPAVGRRVGADRLDVHEGGVLPIRAGEAGDDVGEVEHRQERVARRLGLELDLLLPDARRTLGLDRIREVSELEEVV